jgi:radical SAM/Cys-rich protein
VTNARTALPVVDREVGDLAGPRAARSLVSRGDRLASTAEQLRQLAAVAIPGELDFLAQLALSGKAPLAPAPAEIFQINVGKLCNMTCRHCHVDAGPDRTEENMDRATIDQCLAALDRTACHTVDITGGAPELNPHFTYLVEQAVARGKHVIDRCNLTILLLPRFAHLAAWLAERGVEVVASLPHFRALNTDAQRGDGTYEKSIAALRLLNEVGYGKGDARRRLTLVTNPAGAFLAGDQASLERDWKRELERLHGVTFDRLFALNNMPISRYLEWLVERGQLDEYMTLLRDAFNPAAVGGLMCRNTISVSWDGRLFDCDFNQMLELEMNLPGSRHVRDFDPGSLERREVVVARHCYGCTAGAGSSCGGATT